jgi:hypothetical protein
VYPESHKQAPELKWRFSELSHEVHAVADEQARHPTIAAEQLEHNAMFSSKYPAEQLQILPFNVRNSDELQERQTELDEQVRHPNIILSQVTQEAAPVSVYEFDGHMQVVPLGNRLPPQLVQFVDKIEQVRQTWLQVLHWRTPTSKYPGLQGQAFDVRTLLAVVLHEVQEGCCESVQERQPEKQRMQK